MEKHLNGAISPALYKWISNLFSMIEGNLDHYNIKTAGTRGGPKMVEGYESALKYENTPAFEPKNFKCILKNNEMINELLRRQPYFPVVFSYTFSIMDVCTIYNPHNVTKIPRINREIHMVDLSNSTERSNVINTLVFNIMCTSAGWSVFCIPLKINTRETKNATIETKIVTEISKRCLFYFSLFIFHQYINIFKTKKCENQPPTMLKSYTNKITIMISFV